MRKRISSDLRVRKPLPTEDDNYIEKMEFRIPSYQGYTDDGQFWIGEKSLYQISEGYNKYAYQRRTKTPLIDVITVDSSTGSEMSRKKVTFNKYKFNQSLSGGILHFVYRKVNGKMRDAYGTTNANVLMNNGCRYTVDRRYKTNDNIRYYDMKSTAWRSFKPENVIAVYNSVDVDGNTELQN
jgi:hypothetical protein